MGKICKYPGCKKKAAGPARGLCWTHYGNPKIRSKYANPRKIGGGGKQSKKIHKTAAPKKKRKYTRRPVKELDKTDLEVQPEATTVDGSVVERLQNIGKRIDIFCDYVDREMKTLKQLLG